MPLVKLTVSRAEKSLHWQLMTKGFGVVYFTFLFETTGSNVLGGSWLGSQKIQGFAQLAKAKHLVDLLNCVFICHALLKEYRLWSQTDASPPLLHRLIWQRAWHKVEIPQTCFPAPFCYQHGFCSALFLMWGPSVDPSAEHAVPES